MSSIFHNIFKRQYVLHVTNMQTNATLMYATVGIFGFLRFINHLHKTVREVYGKENIEYFSKKKFAIKDFCQWHLIVDDVSKESGKNIIPIIAINIT